MTDFGSTSSVEELGANQEDTQPALDIRTRPLSDDVAHRPRELKPVRRSDAEMKAGPLSVLHVIGWIAERYGGPPRNVRDVCAALAERGHRIVVLTTDRDGSKRLSERDRRSLSTTHRWEIVRVPTRGPVVSPALARRAWTLVGNADVVHLHGIYSPAIAVAGAIALRRNVPYVQQLHGAATFYDWRRKRWKKAPWDALVLRPLLARAAAALAMTEMEAVQGSTIFPAARMRIVPPPIVDETASPKPVPRSRKWPSTIGFLGRLSQKKGIPILLAAFARLAEDFPEARLVVAGPDDERIGVRMKREADRLGLAGRVSFPGIVVGAEKTKTVEQFDVFVLPSADESFGIAVVEAMEAGLPVVITEQVAIAGEVSAAGAGLIAARNSEDFAAALRQLLSSPADAGRMGAAGRSLALRSYSRAASTAGLERIYEDAISSHGQFRSP